MLAHDTTAAPKRVLVAPAHAHRSRAFPPLDNHRHSEASQPQKHSYRQPATSRALCPPMRNHQTHTNPPPPSYPAILRQHSITNLPHRTAQIRRLLPPPARLAQRPLQRLHRRRRQPHSQRQPQPPAPTTAATTTTTAVWQRRQRLRVWRVPAGRWQFRARRECRRQREQSSRRGGGGWVQAGDAESEVCFSAFLWVAVATLVGWLGGV